MEESGNLKWAKMNAIVEEGLDLAKQRIRTRIEGLRDFDSSNINQLMDFISQVEVELSLAKKGIQTRMMGIDKDGDHDSPGFKKSKLEFRGKISEKIWPGVEIKGERGASMEVALVDASTGNLVEEGTKASLKVEIVLLKGDLDASEGNDWNAEEFEGNIVQDIEGRMSLLKGNTRLKLQRGIARMNSIKLRHRAEEMDDSPMFRLGVRVVDMVYRNQIKEASTDAFIVENYRKKYFKKHKTPSVMDEVFRLVNISKGGKYDNRLKAAGICTVGDFLIQHLRDPKGLESIVRTVPKKWSNTLTNARACKDKREYFYADVHQKTGIVFNDLGEVLRLYSNNQCTLTNMFSENHKNEARELLSIACENWGAVKAFDDGNALRECLELEKLYYPSSSLLNAAGASEMTQGSSSGLSYGIDDVEIVEAHEFVSCERSPSDPSTMYPAEVCHDFEKWERRIRWKKMVCVSWFIGKKVGLRYLHSHKKRKVC